MDEERMQIVEDMKNKDEKLYEIEKYGQLTTSNTSIIKELKQEIIDHKKHEIWLDSKLAQSREEIHLMLSHLSKWDIEAHHTINDDFYEIPLTTFWRPIDLCENIE